MNASTPDVAKKLRVAAVGDLHSHVSHEREHRQLMAEVSEHADVLVLCGDLTNVGLPEEAEHLAADLAPVRIPIVAVLGNHDYHHDHAEEVKKILRRSNVTFLEDETFEINDVGFAGVKGFGGGFGNHMLGAFGEKATKLFVKEAVNEALALENSLARLNTSRVIVVLHYAPIAQTAQGESPEIFPFIGCSRLAETIDRYEIDAVFHGHAHHGTLTGHTPKGVPVYNCCSHVLRRAQGRPFALVEI
jgi:Icc-related predicted phosphoesterase